MRSMGRGRRETDLIGKVTNINWLEPKTIQIFASLSFAIIFPSHTHNARTKTRDPQTYCPPSLCRFFFLPCPCTYKSLNLPSSKITSNGENFRSRAAAVHGLAGPPQPPAAAPKALQLLRHSLSPSPRLSGCTDQQSDPSGAGAAVSPCQRRRGRRLRQIEPLLFRWSLQLDQRHVLLATNCLPLSTRGKLDER